MVAPDKNSSSKAKKVDKKADIVQKDSKVNTEAKNNDSITLNFGFLENVRKNPWMIVSFVLAALLVLSVSFGFSFNSGNSGFQSQSAVEEKVLDFLSSKVDSEVTLVSLDKKGSYYDFVVMYQGDEIPLKSTLDGNYLITDLVPITDSVPDSGVPSAPAEEVDVEIGNSPVKGKANAPVTIVEFSDYQCPFCEKFYTETLSLIEKNYIDTGKVKLVYKDYPLNFHPEAGPAAEAARCFREQKGDEGYFRYHDKLFENQGSLGTQKYKQWAVELGANVGKFEECMESGKYKEAIAAELAYGSSLGVSGTPAFFINGKPLVGAQPYSVFEQIIEAELSAN